MSDGLQSALVGGVVSLVGAAFVYLGVRFTARQSTKAKKEEVEAGAYTRAREMWQGITDDLRKEIAGVRAAQVEDRRVHREEIDQLRVSHRQEIAELRQERREHDDLLNSRIDDLEARDDASRRRIEALTAYIRACLRQMREHQIPPPPAPEGMSFDV